MIIGDRLRTIREEKHLSQGNIETRTGLLRCYVSRVENGHTIPSIETLEKFARALETPLYLLFYEGEEAPAPPMAPRREAEEVVWGGKGKDVGSLNKFRAALGQMKQTDRQLFFYVAQKMAIRGAGTKKINKPLNR